MLGQGIFHTLQIPASYQFSDSHVGKVMIFEHFLNMLLFCVEFVVNKNIFMLKHGVVLYVYALL